MQPVRQLQFVRHGPHASGEDKVWQKSKTHRSNGNKGDPQILVNKSEQEKLWASENIDMKVYNDHTVSTTTTLNSKIYDPMTSLATSPTPSFNIENGAKSTINSNNLITKLNESDKLITWTSHTISFLQGSCVISEMFTYPTV